MNAKELRDLFASGRAYVACDGERLIDEATAREADAIAARALRLLAAAEANDGRSVDSGVMEIVEVVEDIVTAARLTQFYEDPIYKPWSEQVWRSVDTARRTMATRRKVLEAIAEQRTGLAARVAELEKECSAADIYGRTSASHGFINAPKWHELADETKSLYRESAARSAP